VITLTRSRNGAAPAAASANPPATSPRLVIELQTYPPPRTLSIPTPNC
jgi:hypothetical protein